MPKVANIVKCCICNEPKDHDEVEQCEKCLKYVCFDCEDIHFDDEEDQSEEF